MVSDSGSAHSLVSATERLATNQQEDKWEERAEKMSAQNLTKRKGH